MPSTNSLFEHQASHSIYKTVNLSSSVIHTGVNKTLLLGSVAVAMALATSAVPVASKERPPEPVENPGDCPIDAPVRVANVDSLRHFEGLIGHCPETMMIESPAFRTNRPKDDVRLLDTDIGPRDDLTPQLGRPSGKVIIARAPDRLQPAGARNNTISNDPDGRPVNYVAIVPPISAFSQEPGPVSAATPDDQDAVESILALRPQSYSTSFDENIAKAARLHRVDPLLLHAVIKQESGYRQRAVSHAGARGLMQVMPATGRSLGVTNPHNLFDAEVNIAAGAKLLSALWQRFDGDVDLVLAAYNAGEGAVMKYGRSVPPYRETREYVAKVKANYRALAGESGIAVQF